MLVVGQRVRRLAFPSVQVLLGRVLLAQDVPVDKVRDLAQLVRRMLLGWDREHLVEFFESELFGLMGRTIRVYRCAEVRSVAPTHLGDEH